MSETRKTFVLDTNVLLHLPEALFRFGDNQVVIPIAVIEEVDRFKKELTEVGRNARQVSRYLDRLRGEGDLTEGVRTADGGTIRIHLGVPTPRDFPFLENHTADIRILALAWELARTQPPTIFVTKDTNLRIKADAVGVMAEDYRESHREVELDEHSYKEIVVPREMLDRLFADDGGVDAGELEGGDPGPNACLLLRDVENLQHTALARRRPTEPRLQPLQLPRTISGITPRNVEQKFAVDMLLDRDLPLVTLVGKAGTGKTLLALASGLLMTLDRKIYRRLLVARPIYPMGRDLGYLPGDLDEKLRPWMQPIFDNLEYLLSGSEDQEMFGRGSHPIDLLIDQGLLEIEALTYIRGRSLPGQFMIVDEAQNLTPHEVKTVITRAGENTKIVLTGDPDQIDNPYVDAASNGLSYAIQRLQGEAMAGSVTLTRGERSPLAEMAADRL
ncbi:MAG: PhoH family protein [Acidobacteriota bacterium]|nr:PhoH family protein [Acidobacteriota bacterium]MDQ7088307.1 PhoH family protein [Acidobacteriota bacterium]